MKEKERKYQNFVKEISFDDFKVSSETPEYLAKAFLINYERPIDTGTAVQNYRAERARFWYSYLTSNQLTIPIWLLFKFNEGGIV